MKLFSTLLLATLVLASVLVASASAATVGGGTAVNSPNGPDEFGRAWAACLETRDPNSDDCFTAQELSGLGPDEFFEKLQRKLDLLNEQPKQEKRPDAWALMKECAGTRDLASDACRRFIAATGLNDEEVARLGDGLNDPYGTVQATADKKSATSGMTENMKYCVDLRAEMGWNKSVEALTELAAKINSVCPKAIKESRLTPGQFWAKYAAHR